MIETNRQQVLAHKGSVAIFSQHCYRSSHTETTRWLLAQDLADEQTVFGPFELERLDMDRALGQG